MEKSDKVDIDHTKSEDVPNKMEEDITSTIAEDDIALSNLSASNMSEKIETEDNKKIDEPVKKIVENAADTKSTEEPTNDQNKTIDNVMEEKNPEAEDKELKSMSREFKSLIDSSKESKFISESTQIKSKMRKSRKDLLDISHSSVNTSIDDRKENSRRSSINSLQSNSSELSFDRNSAKRSMRSQNPEFLSKHRKFLNSVSGKMLKKADSDSPQSSSDSEYSGGEDTNDESNSSSHRKNERHTKKKKDKTQTTTSGFPEDAEESTDRSDKFCWRCHRQLLSGPTVSRCSVCPRSYHSRCLGGGAGAARGGDGVTVGWVCPECLTVLHAENTDTRSRSMRKVSLSMLCELLKYALKRMMDVNGVEPFLRAVDSSSFPEYGKYVVRPMDLARLKANISSGLYGSTEAFHADTKWILHNCIIFNSGKLQSRLTSAARALVRACRKEMCEIEACPECYAAAHARRPTWFTDACNNPHILLWAKLKGFPYWPAKGMSVNLSNGLVDARFFGAHDRAWVQVRDCFLYSTKDPNPNNKKRQDIADSVKEVQQHVRNLTNKFGTFIPAPFRTPYEPVREQEQLRMMIPGYQGILPLMPMFKARDSDIITNVGRTIRTSIKTVSQTVAKVTSTGSNASSKDSFLEGYGTEEDEPMESEPVVAASRTMADGNSIAADEGTENASDTAGERDKITESPTIISSEASTPEKPDSQNRKRRQSALQEIYTITVMDSKRSKPTKPTTTERDPLRTDSPTDVQLVEEDPLRLSPDSVIHNGPLITNVRTLQQTDHVKNISENSQDANITDTTSIFKVTKSQENLTNMKEAMAKLRELRKKTESVITDKKVSPVKEKVISPVTGNTTPPDKSKIGTIEVRSFARIGNNANETKKTDSDVIELSDVQVKSEPADFVDVERLSDQLAAEKSNLLSSLQLQPSMTTNKISESSKTSDDAPPVAKMTSKVQLNVAKKTTKNDLVKSANNATVISSIVQVQNRHFAKKTSGAAAVKQIVKKHSSPLSNTAQKSSLDTSANKKSTPDGSVNKKNTFEVNSTMKNVFDSANAKNTMVYIPFLPNNSDAGNQTVSVNGSPKPASMNKVDGFVKIAPRLAALKESIAEGAKKQGGEGTAVEMGRGAVSGVGVATNGNTAKANCAVSVATTEMPINLNNIPATIAPTSLPPSTNTLPTPTQLYHGVPIIVGLHSAAGQNLVNGETVVTAGGSGVTASGSTVQRQAPPLQPKPQLVTNPFDPGLVSSDFLLMSAAGPTHKMLNDHAVKIGDFFRKLMEESLESLGSQGNLQASVRTLQLTLEAANWKHKQEMAELVHNTDLVLSEIRSSLEGEKQRALHEVRLQCELDKIASVNEAKTKQWCAQCWQEAQFYCCWNTAYCGYQCQQTHWPKHILTCCQQADSNAQSQQDPTDSMMSNGKVSEESQNKGNLLPSTRVMLRTYGQTSTRGPILTVGPRGSMASSKPSNTIIVNMPTTHVSSAGNMRLVSPQHVYSPSGNIIYKQVMTNNDLDKGNGNKMPGLMLVSSVNTITSCKTAPPSAKPAAL